MIVWTSLSFQQERQPIRLVLAQAETHPSIFYVSNTNPALPTEIESHVNATSASTPAQTPDSISSPGLIHHVTSSAKSLESLESDPAARLIDKTEESWGLTSVQPIKMFTARNRTGPILNTGYIVKRNGVADEDGWSMLGVEVVRAEDWSDTSMRELLHTYRSLNTLSSAIGLDHGVLPLHLITARKAQLGLSSLMDYDRTTT